MRFTCTSNSESGSSATPVRARDLSPAALERRIVREALQLA